MHWPSLQLPVIEGTISRRILANYRVEPAVARRLLPAPFRPKVHRGWAMAGICLIRLAQVRPAFLPLAVGVGSENAAHRFAVEWTDADGRVREGVYIPRRDTSSRFNTLVGGRLFPGLHNHARFDVDESANRFSIAMTSDDGECRLSIRGQRTAEIPRDSVFASLEEASDFFEAGSLGYSATRQPDRFEGLELRCQSWQVSPLAVEQVESRFFDDRKLFPAGSAQFDGALLMENIAHQWIGHPPLLAATI